MSMWMYQLSESVWPPTSYRIDIWENERWSWPVGKVIPSGEEPNPGDSVVFFYATSGCKEPGFYGWGVVLNWQKGEGKDKAQLYFRPVSPSDRMKMHPWGDKGAMELADKVRGRVPLATLFKVSDDLRNEINAGILSWTGSQTTNAPPPVSQQSAVKPA